jgi:hypothetical protein
MTVSTCELRLKFPCSFNLSWKVGNIPNHSDKETIEAEDRIEACDGKLNFDCQMKARAILATSVGSNGLISQSRKVTKITYRIQAHYVLTTTVKANLTKQS